MTRKNMERILAGTAVVLISLTAAGAWLFISGDNQPPTIAEAMSTPSSLTENLYPAADLPPIVQAASGVQTGPAVQIDQQVRAGTTPLHTFNAMDHGRLVASYTTNVDKSSENVYFQDDGIGRSYLVDFYAPLDGDPGPRQKGIVFYAAVAITFRRLSSGMVRLLKPSKSGRRICSRMVTCRSLKKSSGGVLLLRVIPSLTPTS
jgi:hypothetical protein